MQAYHTENLRSFLGRLKLTHWLFPMRSCAEHMQIISNRQGDAVASQSTSLKVAPVQIRHPKVSGREVSRQRVRERLIEAALQAFTEEGYRAASIGRIVEIAETTAPTFY